MNTESFINDYNILDYMKYVPVKIQKVMELEGALRPDFNSRSSVYAHISDPVKRDDDDVQYALLAIFPQHGVMRLGDINPETMMFEDYTPYRPALYTRADNHVVNGVSVPAEQFDRLKTLDEVLAIEGISVKRELFPE